jgi:aarF domain-containing kinase
MMQGNNQAVGSVSNRINILAHWAAIGLAVSSPQQSLKQLGLRRYATEKFRIVVFKVVLVFIDIGFLLTRIRSWWRESLGKKGEGLEDLLQQQVTVRVLSRPPALATID